MRFRIVPAGKFSLYTDESSIEKDIVAVAAFDQNCFMPHQRLIDGTVMVYKTVTDLKAKTITIIHNQSFQRKARSLYGLPTSA